MVHLVCFADGPEIDIVCSSEPFNPLVDENIMNEKITQTISRDPDPEERIRGFFRAFAHHDVHLQRPDAVAAEIRSLLP